MEQYISKSAVVTEFNRLIAELIEEGEDTMFEQGRISAFEDAKLFLDTLKVKEVDLEEEIKKYIKDNICGYCVPGTEESAKYFFELGLKAKGE